MIGAQFATRLPLVVDPSMARSSGLLSRGGLRSRLGFAAALIEQGGAPRRDGEADLVKRKRKRHPRRLVVVVVLALMDDGDQEIVGIELEPIEGLQGGRGVRLAHEFDEALQEPQSPRAAAPVEIAADPGNRRAKDGKDQQAVKDVVAVSLEEGF